MYGYIYIYIYIYIYHLGNNKGVLELMKTYYELKHLSHLDNVYIYIYIYIYIYLVKAVTIKKNYFCDVKYITTYTKTTKNGSLLSYEHC